MERTNVYLTRFEFITICGKLSKYQKIGTITNISKYVKDVYVLLEQKKISGEIIRTHPNGFQEIKNIKDLEPPYFEFEYDVVKKNTTL